LDWCSAWGEDRVYFHDETGRLRRLPAAWTSAAPPDAFVEISAGRSHFRTEDLLQLAALIARQRQAQAPRRRRRRLPKADSKLRALQESGTANPRAHAVQDPAFVDSDFFDAHDLIQVRYEMLRRVRTEGQSITKATTLFGVSRPTFYKVQSDFTRSGLVGLLPAKRGPRGQRKITPNVLRFIEEAVAIEEKLDTQDLAARIAQRFDLVVHWRTVQRALARLKKKAR
jgi:transposase